LYSPSTVSTALNYSYIDEARVAHKGTVRNFYVEVSDPTQAAAMSETIDRAFANSSGETRSASFRENAQQQLQSIGDLSFVIRSIVSAVLAAILFSNAKHEKEVLEDQFKQLNGILNFASYFVGAIMAIGATLGAVNSLYALVDSRRRELATLRAIGFGVALSPRRCAQPDSFRDYRCYPRRPPSFDRAHYARCSVLYVRKLLGAECSMKPTRCWLRHSRRRTGRYLRRPRESLPRCADRSAVLGDGAKTLNEG
jgi:hypothetical protein